MDSEPYREAGRYTFFFFSQMRNHMHVHGWRFEKRKGKGNNFVSPKSLVEAYVGEN